MGARIGILAIVICAIVFVIGLLIGTKAADEALETLRGLEAYLALFNIIIGIGKKHMI